MYVYYGYHIDSYNRTDSSALIPQLQVPPSHITCPKRSLDNQQSFEVHSLSRCCSTLYPCPGCTTSCASLANDISIASSLTLSQCLFLCVNPCKCPAVRMPDHVPCRCPGFTTNMSLIHIIHTRRRQSVVPRILMCPRHSGRYSVAL